MKEKKKENGTGFDYEDDITIDDIDKDVQEMIAEMGCPDNVRNAIVMSELGLPEDRCDIIAAGNDPVKVVNNCRYIKRMLRDRYVKQTRWPDNLAKPPRAGSSYKPPNTWELIRQEAKAALRGKR